MTVVNAWAGAPTDTGFTVRATVTGASTRLLVADNDTLTGATAFGPVTPNNGTAALTATGLAPDTRYWWAVEDDGVVDGTYRGQLRTHPVVGSAASYTIWMGGDAGADPVTPGVGAVLASDRLSNHTVFETIRSRALSEGWLMGLHGGDRHYYDLGSGSHGIAGGTSLANYRRAYDDVLLQPLQHDLARDCPMDYVFGNHDFGIPSDNTLVGKENAGIAYREKTPHYPLPAGDNPSFGGAVYHSFQVGRVLYAVLDTYTERTPESDPDGPAKTALGSSQKAWLRELLETSTASLLVVYSPNIWWAGDLAGPTTWNGYQTEQAELIDMFTDTGWVDRMCIVWPDRHTIGIDSGTNNPGGVPGFQFAAFDCSASTGATWFDQGPEYSGRGQYGTLQVADTGTRITITGTGWSETEALVAYSFSVDTGSVVPPAPVPPPTIARAAIRDAITWLGVHRSTGRIIAELPDVTGDPARRLSAYETARMSIPTTSGGPGHVPHELLDACTDGRSGALVAIVNDLPVWMGLPTLRTGGTASPLTVPCPTTEAYLLKRYVRDANFGDVDRAQVALALARQAEAINGDGQGLGLEYDVEDTGDLISIDYRTVQRIRHYDAIRDLCVGGLEWEIAYDWADNSQTTIVKILRIKRRIGRVDAPQAMFETSASGSVISYTFTETWAEGKYATHVTAVGSGQGEDQPASAPVIDQAAVDAGVPWVELIVSPGSNITETDLLQEYAVAQAARVRGGTTTLNIDAQLDGYPRLGVDALLGDQVSYELASEWHPAPTVASPNDHRLKGGRRMTSWVMHPAQGTWTPGLVDDPMLEA